MTSPVPRFMRAHRQLQELADRVDRVTRADRLFFERDLPRSQRCGRSPGGANMTMTPFFSDRAAVVAIAIRQIIANTLNPDERQLRIEQLLRRRDRRH